MKTPQRNFVVEVKSKRRRSTTRPNSIWGNTDLKALARQAETEAPHLFEVKMGLETSGQNGEMRVDQRPQAQRDRGETGNPIQVAASLNEAAQIDASQHDNDPRNSISRSKKRPPKRRSPRDLTRIREMGLKIILIIRRTNTTSDQLPLSLKPRSMTWLCLKWKIRASKHCWLNNSVNRTSGFERCLSDLVSSKTSVLALP
ncbi:hypothetical protein QA648_31510 (plasmid) [Rhizobium sp. CB3171]|uniref:hypothetical protein n=1 Tax=Rhizobium sp. CB3171 TaxID=3039157 RepID=UPI0024B1F698|nr:hypothetical protein [Rhizobium sp. CB3171]WFU05250.1 hypothetical protein QA648_31510 [Rhizobium sp. CB3171]